MGLLYFKPIVLTLVLTGLLGGCHSPSSSSSELPNEQDIALGQVWQIFNKESWFKQDVKTLDQKKILSNFWQQLDPDHRLFTPAEQASYWVSPMDFQETLAGKRNKELREITARLPQDDPERSWRVYVAFIQSWTQSIDRYAGFFTPLQNDDINRALRIREEGIGIEWKVKDGKIQIVSIDPQGPAFKSQLKPEDRLISVSDDRQHWFDVSSINTMEIISRLKGLPGTWVYLKVQQKDKVKEYPIQRSHWSLTERRVKIEKLGKKWLIKMPYFYEDIDPLKRWSISSHQDLIDQSSSLQNLDWVLDLRGNQGGLLSEASSVAQSMGLSKAWSIRFRSELLLQQPLEARKIFLKPPKWIWVDGKTASAAEVLAGALQEKSGSIIVGQKTYGKGTFQVLQPLDKKGMMESGVSKTGQLLYSSGQIFWPSGQSAEMKGVKINCPLTNTDFSNQSYLKAQQVCPNQSP